MPKVCVALVDFSGVGAAHKVCSNKKDNIKKKLNSRMYSMSVVQHQNVYV